MKKYAYLNRLEELLADLPLNERQDALNYYEEYFEAAGAEHEEETAERLGSPEEVADKILHEGGGSPKRPGRGRVALLLALAVLVLAAIAAGVAALAGGKDAAPSSEQPNASAPPAGTSQPQAAAPSGGEASASAQPGAAYTEAVAGSVQSLELSVNCGRLTVVADSAAAEPSVEIEGIPSDEVSLTYRNEELELVSRHEEKVGSITLVLPADLHLDTVQAENQVGKIELEGVQAETLDLHAAAGDVSVSGCTAQTMDLRANAGSIALQDGSADSIQARAQVGRVSIDGTQCTDLLDLQANVGGIEATLPGTAEDYAFSGGTVIGKVDYDGQMYSEETAREDACRLQVQSEVGSIRVRFSE